MVTAGDIRTCPPGSPARAVVAWRDVVDQRRPRLTKFAALADDAETDVSAFMNFLRAIGQSCIHSSRSSTSARTSNPRQFLFKFPNHLPDIPDYSIKLLKTVENIPIQVDIKRVPHEFVPV